MQQHNPYSPPTAEAIDLPPSEVVRRPFAVWLLVGVLLAFAILWVGATIRSIGLIVGHADRVFLVVPFVLRLLILAAILFMMIDAFRRGSWGRWGGVVLIGLLLIFSLLPRDEPHYVDEAQRVGQWIGKFLMLPALLVWWGYAFAFSAKARRYFSSE